MGLLPLSNASRILVVPEVIFVLRFCQPRFLVLLSANLAALGFEAEALARCAAVVRNKIFIAVETLAALLRSLHRVPKIKGTSLQKTHATTEENPRGRKSRVAKKEEKLSANGAKKIDRRRSNFKPPVLGQFHFAVGTLDVCSESGVGLIFDGDLS